MVCSNHLKLLTDYKKNCNKLHRTHPKYQKYIAYRNTFNKTKRHVKFKYYHDLIVDARTNSSKTWNILNSLIGKLNNKHEVAGLFKLDGTLTNDRKAISNGFCDFFSNVGSNLAKNIPKFRYDFNHYLPEKNPDTIYLTPTDPFEIINILNNLKPKKSSGIEDISNQLLKKLSSWPESTPMRSRRSPSPATRP